MDKPDFHEIWLKVDRQAREKFAKDTKHLHIDDYVAWCRYTKTSIVTCDSDAPGAFKVYRHSGKEVPEASPCCTHDPNTCSVGLCDWPKCQTWKEGEPWTPETARKQAGGTFGT